MSRTSLSVGFTSSWGGVAVTPHSDPMITDWKGLSSLPANWANFGAPLTFDARGVTADPSLQIAFQFSPKESILAVSPSTLMIAIDVATWAAGTSGVFGLLNNSEVRFNKYSLDTTKVDSQFVRDSIVADPSTRSAASTGLYVASGTYDGVGTVKTRLFHPSGAIMAGTSSGSATDYLSMFSLINFAILSGDVFYVAHTGVWFSDELDNTELQAQAESWGWVP